MTQQDSDIEDLDLALALRRLAAESEPPPIDPRREAALLAAFDARAVVRRPVWGLVGLASAAALLIATVLVPLRAGRHGNSADGLIGPHRPAPSSSSRDAQPDRPPGDFVIVPGAAALPPLESGSLVRMDLPVAVLPSLGLVPPAGSRASVRADVIVGQDGLTRAVRLVD